MERPAENPHWQNEELGEIARAIGKPKAVRADRGACGANPIPVLVPCHRVLAANEKIGGFSGGLEWKRELLARKEFLVAANVSRLECYLERTNVRCYSVLSSTCRQPDDFAQRRLRSQFHEVLQFFHHRLAPPHMIKLRRTCRAEAFGDRRIGFGVRHELNLRC